MAFVENPGSIDECKPFGLMLEQELVKLISLASAVMLNNTKYCLSVKLQGMKNKQPNFLSSSKKFDASDSSKHRRTH